MTDRSVPWSAEDQALAQQWPAAVLVHNKCDLPAPPGIRPIGLSTSALCGEGIDILLAAIGRRLLPDPPPPGRRCRFVSEQVEMLRRWLRRGEKKKKGGGVEKYCARQQRTKVFCFLAPAETNVALPIGARGRGLPDVDDANHESPHVSMEFGLLPTL